MHDLNPSDRVSAFPDYSPDAELGGDSYSTKASGGYWPEISSRYGKRKWLVSFSCKKAAHTSGPATDSETWSLVGAHD